MRYTLRQAEEHAANMGSAKCGDMLLAMCEEVRRVQALNRKLRKDLEVIQKRADAAERKIRHIESRGILL